MMCQTKTHLPLRALRVLPGFILCCLVMVLGACGIEKDDEFVDQPFEGLTALEENSDGTWTLSWEVAADESPVYLIYQARKDEEFDYEKPFFSTSETTFTSEILFFQESRCFVVRVSTEKLVTDTNENILCTEKRDLTFQGLTAIDQDSNGHYILSWSALPIPGMRYAIYSRIAGDDSLSRADIIPLDLTSNSVFDAGVIDRGVVRCYWVELETTLVPLNVPESLKNAVSDELCTDQEEDITFQGISALDYGEEPLTMVITWEGVPSEEIVEFRIYEGPQQESLQVTIEAGDPAYYNAETNLYTYVVNTSSENRVYHWSVRAADTVNREDSNTKTIALRANIEFVK